MEFQEKLERLENFFRQSYQEPLAQAISKGKLSILIDYKDLEKFDPQIADILLDEPEEIIKISKSVVNKINPLEDAELSPCFYNLGEAYDIKIRDLRSHHLSKFLSLSGMIKRASEVRPEVISATFECMSCGNTVEKDQKSTTLRGPYECDCGSRKFEITEKKMVDVQIVNIEESPESLEGSEQPSRINVYLRGDLVDPEFQKRVVPGNKVQITGILKEAATKFNSKRYDIFIEANYIQSIEMEFEEIQITPEEEREILDLAKKENVLEILVDNVAPSIWGYREVKRAIALQLFSGVRKERADGVITRGDMHILLIGEPGTGKSAILKFTGKLAPKGRYVVGKGASAAGLTATVVRDELSGGFALEAGALVLANKGLVGIDEIDKMGQEDRSALHEAMEQQCFGPYSQVHLPDGSKVPIANIVDPIIENYSTKKSKDCKEIVKLNNKTNLQVLSFNTSNFSAAEHKVSVVGRRPAPTKMLKITLENGRTLEVTQKHPFYFLKNGELIEIEARNLEKGGFVASPAVLPVKGEEQDLRHIEVKKGRKAVQLPIHNSPELCSLVGYHVSDGSDEQNRGQKNGIKFTNSDEVLVNDYVRCINKLFKVQPHIRERNDRQEVKTISKEIFSWLTNLGPELVEIGSKKKIPEKIMECSNSELVLLLKAFFGGGGVYKVGRGFRVRAVCENKELLEQIQELLLRLGIASSIYQDNKVWRIELSKYEDILRFKELVGFLSPAKMAKIEEAVKREKRSKVPVPGVSNTLMELIQRFGLNQKDFIKKNLVRSQNISRYRAMEILQKLEKQVLYIAKTRKNLNTRSMEELSMIRKSLKISAREISENLCVSASSIHYWEKKGTKRQKEYASVLRASIDARYKLKSRVSFLKNLLENVIWLKIKQIREFKPPYKFIYDLTVPKSNNFLCDTIIAHNSVTISKANIHATLSSRTSVLAAGNPKFGRFDPFKPVGQQINISDTLLSRFDLIFTIRDFPSKERDAELTEHILGMHRDPKQRITEIDNEFIRKYVSYAKRNVAPGLTKEASEEIKKFYVGMRNKRTTREEGDSSIPMSVRQLEALVRMSEAAAKARLSEKVEKKDAQLAIELLMHCLKEVGVDPETGEFDIDRIEAGITSTQRNKIRVLREIIGNLGQEMGGALPLEDVIAAAEEKGISEVDDLLSKLKREGEIFEPRQGYIQKI